jgi:hypothetical protein
LGLGWGLKTLIKIEIEDRYRDQDQRYGSASMIEDGNWKRGLILIEIKDMNYG